MVGFDVAFLSLSRLAAPPPLAGALCILAGLPSCASGSKTDSGAGGEVGGAPDEVELTLTFRAVVGDRAFACGETYADQGATGVDVTPRDFRFYVSAVALVTEDGGEVPFQIAARAPFQSEDVALLDFEDGSAGCTNGNAALNARVTGRAPQGRYSGLVFSTSVPFELNHADPTDASPPLQAGGMTWGWLLGYKFMVAELGATTTHEGAPPGLGLFHLGSVGCSGGEECSAPNRNRILLPGFDASRDAIVADIGALMRELDLSQTTNCHSSEESCAVLLGSVGLDLVEGTLSTKQTTFRVESR